MTEDEMEKLAADLRAFLDGQKGRRSKGLFSKVIVALCILLAVGYTGACLLIQWAHGTSPEPQLTIAFFGFITVELWSLAKIKRDKNKKDGEK